MTFPSQTDGAGKIGVWVLTAGPERNARAATVDVRSHRREILAGIIFPRDRRLPQTLICPERSAAFLLWPAREILAPRDPGGRRRNRRAGAVFQLAAATPQNL